MNYTSRHASPEKPPLITHNDNSGKRTEFIVNIAGNHQRRGFEFRVNGNEIKVTPGARDRHLEKDSDDWQVALSDHEKANVMNRILALYRTRSRDKGEFKIASVGVTESGNAYIAVNGSLTSNEFSRQCAEQTMVTIGSEREAFKQERAGNHSGADTRYKEVYIMGGGPDVHVMGPCGNCTDLLASVMPDEGKVFILHASDGKKPIGLIGNVTSVDAVPRGACWLTDAAFLNRSRHIDLPEEHRHHQIDAEVKLKHEVRDWLDRDVEEEPNIAIRGLTPRGQPIGPQSEGARPPALMDVPLDKLNEYMREQIQLTVANRVHALAKRHKLGSLQDLSADEVNHLIEDEVGWARCVVIQRDDGKLFAAVTVKTPVDKAAPSAEVNALGQAMRKLGTQGIRHVWCQEFNPRLADEGKMRTSPKEGIERLLKRRSMKTGTVDFFYIPYNEGGLDARAVGEIMIHRDARTLFPSAHVGSPRTHTHELASKTPTEHAQRPRDEGVQR